MERQAVDFITASRAAVAQAGALAVQYAMSVIGAVILLSIGWLIANLLHGWALRALGAIRGFDETLARFFATVLRYGVLIMVFVMVLGQFGVQTASIVAALGAAGLAIGLALQGTLQNIAAGIMLLVLRPFRVGEYIETPAIAGTVREIGLFATELRNKDGLFLLAPNSLLWNTPVTNYSRESARRHELKIKVTDDKDIAEAEARLRRLIAGNKDVRSNPPPQVYVSEAGDGFATVTLSYWVGTPDYERTTRAMNKAVKESFRPEPAPAE